MKAKKFICMFMFVIMIVSTSVGATSYDGSHIHSSEVTTFALPGGGDTGIAQPMNILCDLFGHSDETYEEPTDHLAQTKCINVGDSYCEAKCVINIHCDRCKEAIDTRWGHVFEDYCIRRKVAAAGEDPDAVAAVYDCPSCT